MTVTEPTPPSDLDLLMTHLANLDNTDPGLWTDRDINIVIEYQRRQRGQREAGIKPKRPKAAGTVKLTLSDLGFKAAMPAAGKGMRRV